MVTCWIALVPCGDAAPGLEIASAVPRRLLPAELARGTGGFGAAGATGAAEAAGTWRPVLAAGDALAFDGTVPHRTHAAASMTGDRTSLELRFLATLGRSHCPRAGRLLPLAPAGATAPPHAGSHATALEEAR